MEWEWEIYAWRPSGPRPAQGTRRGVAALARRLMAQERAQARRGGPGLPAASRWASRPGRARPPGAEVAPRRRGGRP
jgi:hypothetical protein